MTGCIDFSQFSEWVRAGSKFLIDCVFSRYAQRLLLATGEAFPQVKLLMTRSGLRGRHVVKDYDRCQM